MNKQKQNRTGSEKSSRLNIGSVIDIVIILLILAAAVGIGFRIYTVQNPAVSADKTDYEISFRIDSISYMMPGYLQEGDRVYLRDSGKLLGTLINEGDVDNGSALAISPATVTVLDEGGHYVSVNYPDESLVDAVGRILATGYRDASGSFLLDGKTHVTPGEQLHVRTELVDFVLTIVEITQH